MSSRLHNLENESIALLYLADELSVEDRAQVEQMLKSDAALRNQLDELRGAQSLVDDALKRADASTPRAISEAAAIRKVSRAMAQWKIDWLARPKTKPARPFQWRSLVPAGVAAAALLIIGMSVWWSRVRSESDHMEAVTQTFEDPSTPRSDPQEQEQDGAQLAIALAGDSLSAERSEGESLAGVEEQLAALTHFSQSMREDGISR